MRAIRFAFGLCLAVLPATAHPAVGREQVAAMLIDRGYSCVAFLHLDRGVWHGDGYDRGRTVRFRVDAATNRLLAETPPPLTEVSRRVDD